MTVLNQQEFATNPARLRANQAAIDGDTAQARAAVKTDTDSLYAGLRRYLTSGGPSGGPAVTPPPATIMSRLTDAQQDAVTAQVTANIEGRASRTDPQTWYAIRQGLTSVDAGERQRWASKNLTQFMGQLSTDDLAALEKLQTTVRSNDGSAEQSRLQTITRMASDALRSIGIDPTPRADAAPGSDAAQAAMFHRAAQDELLAFESNGRKPTETDAYDIVYRLKDTGLKSGWLKVREPAPTMPFSRNDGEGRWVDPNVVWVAGDDKDRNKESESIPDRFPGSGSSVGADQRPHVLQIDPEAPSGGVGFAPPLAPPFRAGGPKPTPSAGPLQGTTESPLGSARASTRPGARGASGGEPSSKPTVPASPSSGGATKLPGAGNDSSPEQDTAIEARAERPIVGTSQLQKKVVEYLLNPDHTSGAPKAKWFREALGFTKDNMNDLVRQLIFKRDEATATTRTEWGQKFEQVIELKGANGRTIPVLTVWIQKPTDEVDLITAVPTDK